jgi:hypothetical protein
MGESRAEQGDMAGVVGGRCEELGIRLAKKNKANGYDARL